MDHSSAVLKCGLHTVPSFKRGQYGRGGEGDELHSGEPWQALPQPGTKPTATATRSCSQYVPYMM